MYTYLRYFKNKIALTIQSSWCFTCFLREKIKEKFFLRENTLKKSGMLGWVSWFLIHMYGFKPMGVGPVRPFLNELYTRMSIPYQRLYRFGHRYDIFRIPVNTGIPFQIYRYIYKVFKAHIYIYIYIYKFID